MYRFRRAFDDVTQQTLLYLYSDRSGGTGKSWLASLMDWYFNSHLPGGHCNYVSDFDGYTSPHDFNAHLVVLDDFNPNKI